MVQDDKATEHPDPHGAVPAVSMGHVFISRVVLSALHLRSKQPYRAEQVEGGLEN